MNKKPWMRKILEWKKNTRNEKKIIDLGTEKKIKIIMIWSMNSDNYETVTTDLRELILADPLLPTDYRV